MSEATGPTPSRLDAPVWIEIPAADVAACKRFYAKVFPSWTWTPATEQYPEEKLALFGFRGVEGLSGGIVEVPAECKSDDLKKGVGVTIYHLVESIEETKATVEEVGGKAITGKEAEGNNGWHMHFKDVAGNRFGIYQVKK